MRAPVVAAVLAALTASRAAAAQPVDNDYAIDLFQGPILAPTRVLAMGGAYAGLAEGLAGVVANAAAPAVRHAYSTNWWEGELDFSVSIPTPLSGGDDFDDSGNVDADYSSFIYLSGGGLLQAGPFGLGLFGDLQRYTLTFPPDDAATVVTVGRYHALAAWLFFGDQLSLGGGARAVTLGISSDDAQLTIAGAAPQLGFLLKPDYWPFRLGVTYRHQVRASTSIGSGGTLDASGIERAGRLVLPEHVELPWEVEIGTALQVGPRPLNPPWINPVDHEADLRAAYQERAAARRRHLEQQLRAIPEEAARDALRGRLLAEEAAEEAREAHRLELDLELLDDERLARAQNWPRSALLLTLDLVVTGSVTDAIGLEPFLAQVDTGAVPSECRPVASGADVVVSPRLGIEMEPWPGWLHTRLGTYYEPQRYSYEPERCNDRPGRQHFTFGADIKLLTTTWFGLVPEITYKLQGYADLAARYQSFGGGFGVWY
jgi:hypothetical protein